MKRSKGGSLYDAKSSGHPEAKPQTGQREILAATKSNSSEMLSSGSLADLLESLSEATLQRRYTMMMLTQENRKKLQPLYATEDKLNETQVAVKFFDPYGSWTWYAWEFDGEDLFFGLVVGMETELGYFSLSELESLTTPWGHPNRIERDRHYRQEMVCELLDRKGYG